MRSAILLSALSSLALVAAQSDTVPVTGLLGNASVVTDNPLGVTYTATLPNKNTTTVRGSVKAVANSNGTGVAFTVAFSGLPSSGGPFLYHIHDQPVPTDGNCTGTLGHLDPTKRGEMPPCDPTLPETCQVGDLSGKYGKVISAPFSASFVDPYASTKSGLGAFFGNRSITFHFANTTRITCANFTLTGNGTSNGTVTPTSPTIPAFTGGAAGITISAVAVLGGLFAALMF